MSGNPPPRRKTQADVAGTVTASFGSRGQPAPDDAGLLVTSALTANGLGVGGADDNQAQAGHLIAHTLMGEGHDAGEDGTGRGTPLVATCLVARQAKGVDSDCTVTLVPHANTGVRKLMPIECEFLQGLKGGYTLIPYGRKRKKPAADSPRYRAIGNSMAVPVMRWIGQRIALVDAII